MNRTRRTSLASLTAILLLIAAPPTAMAQIVDEVFDIAYGQTVADGVPAEGAGNIELGGATDAYRFAGEAGDLAIFDVLAGSAGTFFWRLEAPSGVVLFDAFFTDRNRELPETGTYVLTVRGATAATTGTYSFRLLLTPPAEEFAIAIGDTVSDGVPAPGAGNIEVAGAIDRYRFHGTAGRTVIFDVLSGSTNQVSWSLHAPDGTQVFDSFYVDRDHTLTQTGTYTLTVRGLNVASSGVYSFRLRLAAGTEEFTIAFGDTVSDGVPAPGAGNLEGPGAVDRYLFEAAAGQVALFDALTGSTNAVSWQLESPGGTVLFDAFYVDQQTMLPETGTYVLTVEGLSPTSFGTYSFRLVEVAPRIDEFTITFGDTVADGVPAPGAGNLEGPGAIDRYLFEGTAGQLARFEVLTGSANEVAWHLEAPDGTALFDAFFVDQEVVLPTSGTHVLEVRGLTIATFGVYSFTLLEPPPDEPPPNAPPTIDQVEDQENTAGDTVSLQVTATDPEGGVLTYTATGLPSGLEIDPGSGHLSGTIAGGADTTSPYAVAITVTDAEGAAASIGFTWVVLPPRSDAMTVRIDVLLPCVFVNGVGVIPVVVHGDQAFDGRQVDLATVELEGMPVKRILGRYAGAITDVDRDGILDVVVLIDERSGAIPKGTTSATLTGRLQDGSAIEGRDDELCRLPTHHS